MKLAIGHYHLNRGGVTRVIENQLLALDRTVDDRQRHEAIILYGGLCQDWPVDLPDRLQRIRLRLYPVPELDYDGQHRTSTGNLGQRLMQTLQQLNFTPAETVVHIHNHSIGKNAALPRAVWDLAERGYGLLLQIHDFAEDQRPGNFRLLADAAGGQADWHRRLYPQAPSVHFAVLNGRDRGILQSAGVAAEQLHFLPNPVLLSGSAPDRDSTRIKLDQLFSVPTDARFVVYPVRGIRRKNLGESLLHSLLAPEGTFFGMTLPPLNPAERARYEQWKTVALRLRPPFRFELGGADGLSLAENLAACDAVLTTSVAEGFGMVYLETWLADRPLMGRDLPEITQDFTAVGLNLTRLGHRLGIPADWLDLDRLGQTFLDAFRVTMAAYNRPEPSDLGRQVDHKLRGDTVDFGDLDESFQIEVIDRVAREASARNELLATNPWIAPATGDGTEELVRANAGVVRRKFSLEPSGARLAAVYQAILESPRGHEIQPLARPGAILDHFLDVARFRLLRN